MADSCQHEISRDDVIGVLRRALEPEDSILAMWEAGAISFGRVDEWSDIDLYVVVEDDMVEEAIRLFDGAISSISAIRLRYRLPEPTWHGHSQIFCTLDGASPFLFLDAVFMKESAKEKFLQFQIHGTPAVHFDKAGIVRDDPVDRKAFGERLVARLEELKVTFAMFQVLTPKELNRANLVEALVFYMGQTFRPLVEVLRMKYCPLHYNFFGRYVHYELPDDVVTRLESLAFVSGPEDLRAKHQEAGRWFWETISCMTPERVRDLLERTKGF